MDKNKSYSVNELNLLVIDTLAEKLKEFCEDNEQGRALPHNYSIIKLEKNESRPNDVVLKFSGNKDKAGLLRYVCINIIEIV